MSGRGAGRKKPEARRAPTREPKERFLVLTEGARTERDYLEAFAQSTRGALVEVFVPPEHGMPITLVQTAKRRRDDADASARRERDDNLRFDAVWCVFDVDQHPNLKTAIEEARTAGVEVAVSNPCFELWLLLHFRESPGPRTVAEMGQLVRNFVAGYEKRVDFARFATGYAEASRRAQRLQAAADELGEPNRNPTTGVWRLTEAVRKDAPLNGDTLGRQETSARNYGMLKYIEQKTGHADNGPDWIARVTLSKSGRTVYFNGRALKRLSGGGVAGNHFDIETGDEYWISGVKKRGVNRHWAGSGAIMIEAGAVNEYLLLAGQTALDASRFQIVGDIPETDPSKFYDRENQVLNQ